MLKKQILKLILIIFISFNGFFLVGCNYEMITNHLFNNIDNDEVTSETIVKALKQNLSFGIQEGISELGREDGFFANPNLRISIPKDSENMLGIILKYKGSKDIDNFVLTMNRTAEDSVSKTVNIFLSTLENLSINNGYKILMGRKNEATLFFKSQSKNRLIAVISPIIEESMINNNVAKSYKTIVNIYKKINNLITSDKDLKKFIKIDKPKIMTYEEIIDYVVVKIIDGVFIKIGEKELQIRTNKKERTTNLLRKVFKLQDVNLSKALSMDKNISGN